MEQLPQTRARFPVRFLLQSLFTVSCVVFSLGLYVALMQFLWLRGKISFTFYFSLGWGGGDTFNPLVGIGIPLVFALFFIWASRFVFRERKVFFVRFFSILLCLGFFVIVPLLYRYQQEHSKLPFEFLAVRQRALYGKALTKNDARICERLVRGAPVVAFDLDGPITDPLPSRDVCLGTIAGRAGNVELCRCEGDINSDIYCVQYKDACIRSMVSASRNPRFCLSLSEESAQQSSCLHDFALLFEDSAICDLIPKGETRHPCYFDLAPERVTLQMCEELRDQKDKQHLYLGCVKRLASVRNDPSLCSIFDPNGWGSDFYKMSSFIRYDCLVGAIESSKLTTATACAGIYDQDDVNDCILRVAQKKKDIALCDESVPTKFYPDSQETCRNIVRNIK